jgi:hypothetical protein
MCIAMVAFPVMVSAGDDDIGMAPANAEDEPGVTFQIQDYIPGTFESRLQYLSANGGINGEWNEPIWLGRSGSYNPHTAYYFLSQNMYDDYSTTNITSVGTYNWSSHRESPRRTIDTHVQITGYYAPRKTKYLDDEIEVDYSGYGRIMNGTREDNALNADVRYTTSRWHYTRNSWAYLLNPTLRAQRSQSTRIYDVDERNQGYNVSDTLALEFSNKRGHDDESELTWLNTEIDLLVAVGRGRVYDGTSTWRAIDLLEMVAELSGIPATDIGGENYEQLAAVLYKLNQRKYPSQDRNRLLDFERTERVVEEVERVLRIDNLTPRAIAAIHDILKYYPTFTRSFGQRWYFLVSGEYTKSGLESSNTNHDYYYDDPNEHYIRIRKTTDEHLRIEQTLRTSAGLIYESYRPISTRWQLNVRGAAYLHNNFETWEGTEETSVWSHYWDSDTTESYSERGDTVSCWTGQNIFRIQTLTPRILYDKTLPPGREC